MRAFPLLPCALLLGILGSACPPPSSPPPQESPCALAVASQNGPDAVLEGTGACGGKHPIHVRLATGSAATPVWDNAGLELQGTWTASGAMAHRTAAIHNPGTQDVMLVGLEWTVEASFTQDHRMLHNGYQSWSYTGMETVPAALDNNPQGTVPSGGDNGHELEEVYGVSWWWTSVATADNSGVVLGADGATVFKTVVGVERNRLRVRMGLSGDALVVHAGETVTLDGLVFGLGDVREGLDHYASLVASTQHVTQPLASPLGGWGSWNFYYANIQSSQLREEATWATTNLLPLGLDTLLLDDGYEPRWGEWEASPAFGDTLPTLASTLTSSQLKPALWLAPFLVDTTSSLVAAHPDWFVHVAGEVKTDRLAGGQTVAYLDASQPDALLHVTSRMQALFDAGFHTFKIDFLYGGAMEGQRHLPVTSMQAYRMFLAGIRQAVPLAHLVGCGAPMLPSVGLVDSMRTGSDIAFTVSPGPVANFYTAESRQTAMRSYTDAWWALDPDVLILRDNGAFSDQDAWTATVATAMAGGNYLLGDGRQASPLRMKMALDPAILEMVRDGHAARPVDFSAAVDPDIYGSPLLDLMGQTEPPHVHHKHAPNSTTHWLMVFAWAVEDFSAQVELPGDAVELLPPQNATTAVQAVAAPRDGKVAVPKHGVRLFKWTQAANP